MGKRTTASKAKAVRARKGRSSSSRPQRPAVRRSKKALLKGKPRGKPAVRKPRAKTASVRIRIAKSAAARRKKTAPKKPAPQTVAQVTEKRSHAVEKLLALKAEKTEKPAPKKEGFLIKAPKKAKQENLVTSPRFTRRLPPPAPSAVPVKPPTGKPGKVVLRQKDLDELRRALNAERQRLIAQLQALDETASLTGPSEVNENVPGYSIHLAEYASENQVVETTLAQRALQAERLVELEEALQRINRPGFGICQNCDKAIGLERLKVKPFAQFCVPCRQLKEQGKILF